MKEDKLQAKVVLWFKQKYPQYQKMLIAINNNSISASQAMYHRSMGLSKSAPDLIFLHRGRVLGLELKAPNSRHNKQHVEQQLLFGVKMFENGFFYYMESDFEKIRQTIDVFFEDIEMTEDCVANLESLIEKVKNIKTKTIKF